MVFVLCTGVRLSVVLSCFTPSALAAQSQQKGAARSARGACRLNCSLYVPHIVIQPLGACRMGPQLEHSNSEAALWGTAFSAVPLPASVARGCDDSMRQLLASLSAAAQPAAGAPAALAAARCLERLKAAVPTDGEDAAATLASLAGSREASLLVARALLLSPSVNARAACGCKGGALGALPSQCIAMAAHIVAALSFAAPDGELPLDELEAAVGSLCGGNSGSSSSSSRPAAAAAPANAAGCLQMHDGDWKLLGASFHSAGGSAAAGSAAQRSLLLLAVRAAAQRALASPSDETLVRDAVQRAAAGCSEPAKSGDAAALVAFVTAAIPVLMRVPTCGVPQLQPLFKAYTRARLRLAADGSPPLASTSAPDGAEQRGKARGARGKDAAGSGAATAPTAASAAPALTDIFVSSPDPAVAAAVDLAALAESQWVWQLGGTAAAVAAIAGGHSVSYNLSVHVSSILPKCLSSACRRAAEQRGSAKLRGHLRLLLQIRWSVPRPAAATPTATAAPSWCGTWFSAAAASNRCRPAAAPSMQR